MEAIKQCSGSQTQDEQFGERLNLFMRSIPVVDCVVGIIRDQFQGNLVK